MATSLNLEAVNNADWRQPLAVTDADGAALNLIGAQIHMQVEDRAGASVLSLSVGSGLTITDAAQGHFQIDVDAAQMVSVPSGTYAYDLLIEIDGLRLVAARGVVLVQQGITEWPD